jgi:small-conductance mechanosensitive channel
MKRPVFMEGVGVALLATIAGGVLFSVLTTVFVSDFVLRLLIAVTGLFYVLYLLHRSGEKVGRITSISVWLFAAAVVWLMGLSLPLYLMVHLGLVWLIRSLYFYSSLISALADFGLVLFGLASAVWAVLQTGSLSLGVWCFFLVQALFVVIPNTWKRSAKTDTVSKSTEESFQGAYRTAQAALNKLSTLR